MRRQRRARKPKRPILIIEGDPPSGDLTTAILRDAGFAVLSASDGPSGIELARGAEPAVIIVDLVRLGTEGISTCRRLKEDPLLGEIPVVTLTSSEDWKSTQEAFLAGAEFFLPKPIEASSLVQMMQATMQPTPDHIQEDRRQRHPRLPAEVPVRCLAGGKGNGPQELVGRTGNLSLSGLLLLLPERLAPGSAVRLQLQLPEKSVIAKGVIVWQGPEQMGEGQVPHGVQLWGLSDNVDLAMYRRYLSQLAAGGASRQHRRTARIR
ncbi:MAG: two-component system response regulator [Candidatus Methylomirabilales bacterium]